MKAIIHKLRGRNNYPADKYAPKTDPSRQDEIETIKENIKACQIEKNALMQELQALQEEHDKYAMKMELLDFAMAKAKEYTLIIHAAAQKDVAAIQDKTKQKLAIHNNYLSEINDEITKLQQLTNGYEDMEDNENDPVTGKVVGTILPSAGKSEIILSAPGNGLINENNDIIGKVLPFIRQSDKPGDPEKDSAENDTEEPAGPHFAAMECNRDEADFWGIEFTCDNAVTAAEITTAAPQPATMEEIASTLEPAPADAITGILTVPGGQAGPRSTEIDQEEGLYGFWSAGNMEDNMEAGTTTGGRLFSAPEPTKTQAPQPVTTETAAPGGANGSQHQPRVTPPQSSPAVAQEIKTVRHKYVAGKLAGEDLFNHSGQIIIRKNELITAAIIDKAEHEGKLAELIIHMVIPGLEDNG